MKNVQFQGEIPEHLLSADSLERRERKTQEVREFKHSMRRLLNMANAAVDACRFGRGTLEERREKGKETVSELTGLLRAAPTRFEMADIASQVPVIACILFKGDALDIPHLREQLMGLNLVNDPRSITGGKPMFERKFDAAMRKYAKSCELRPGDSDMLRSLMVDAGMTAITDLPIADLRYPVVGAALERNPQRITEVKHLEAFLDLALSFQIDVDLPADLAEARAAQHREAVMQRGIKKSEASAADPLAAMPQSNEPQRSVARRTARHP